MIEDIKLPEISENVEQASVVSILVSPGDQVATDQAILEIETDKASAEVPSTVSGIVKEILVSEGDEVAVGSVIARVDTEGAQAEPSAEEPAEDAAAPAEEAEAAPAPAGGESVGSAAAAGAPAAKPAEEGQTRPDAEQTVASAAPADEAPVDQASATGDEAAAGAGPPPGAAAPGTAPPEQAATEAGKPIIPPTAGGRVPAAPSTRRLARELGVDITEVTGTGPGGRVSADDVKRHTKERVSAARGPGAAEAGLAGAVTLPDFSKWGPVWREKLSTVRRITGENTQAAWRTIPHVTQFDEADVTAVEEFRTRFAKRVERSGAKLTVTAILMKVVARALRRFPRFNSSLDASAGEIIYKDYVHISVAADTDRGLLVPVIRDADRKSILTLSKELGELAERARNKQIKPEEMEGGTFTISNLGGIGGTGFTPVVFPPQVAILGVARAETKPVWQDGEFVPRLRLPLSLSYDHRVVDGADGARFLRWICESLEQPLFMELEGEGDE